MLATQWYPVRAKSMLINKHLSTQHYRMDGVMSPQRAGSRWHSKAQITDASSLLPYTYQQRRGNELNSIKFWRQFKFVIRLEVQYLWIVSHWTPETQSQSPILKLIPWAHLLNLTQKKRRKIMIISCVNIWQWLYFIRKDWLSFYSICESKIETPFNICIIKIILVTKNLFLQKIIVKL